MLRGIRKASANWLGRVVLLIVVAFLVFSFAIWGIGDIFRGFGQSTVATVGKTEIQIENFRRLYTEQLQRIARQTGRAVSPDEARALGLDRQLLSRLMAEAALDERAQTLRLGLSDAALTEGVVNDPAFRGLNGAFDRTVFERAIREVGYTEATFLADQRRLSLRRQVSDAISGQAPRLGVLEQAVARFQTETRTVSYVTFDSASVGQPPAPTPEQLQAYFDERKALFRAPEYRSGTILTVSVPSLSRWIEVSDQDAQGAYLSQQARFSTPERRQVWQIKFGSMDEAQAADAKLKAGMTFEALAAERNLKSADYDLGLVTRATLVDPAIAEAAFALADGGVSGPVSGRFGVAILRVAQVQPGSVRPFAQVADELKREIATNRARTQLNETHDKVEDARASGLRLSEVAQQIGLQVETIDAIDRSGRDAAGAAVTGDAANGDILRGLFASEIGVENDPIQLQGQGFIWYEVTGITPSRERTFEEARERVEARWVADQIAQKVKAQADAFQAKITGGLTLGEVAASDQLDARTVSGVGRLTKPDNLPQAVGEAAFRVAKGGVTSADSEAGEVRYVVQVMEVDVPAADTNTEVARRIAEEIRQTVSQDLLSQYVVRLQGDLGSRINTDALRRIVGGEGG
jgi:peptidyl-prolyl cis-trans isomerase D